MALAVVLIMSAVLFLLATTLLMVVSYRGNQTVSGEKHNQAMHVAEAGINEYMYQLSVDYGYWQTHETLGPVNTEDGQWLVTRSQNSSDVVILTSVGTLNDGTERTVRASVSFPSWAKYIVCVDQGPYSIGAGATFYGDVHCNEGISNSGVITGRATAGLGANCTWGTSAAANYPGGYKNNYKNIDFSQLTYDLAQMKSTAQAESTYKAASGFLGYQAVINGATVTITKIQAINKNLPRTGYPSDPLLGAITTTGTAEVYAIPHSGVFFFDDNVWVTGNYSASVTFATSKNVYCPGNITPTTSGANVTCGLVAQLQVLFPWWYQTMPDDQMVQAACLSQTAGVGPEAPSGLKKYNTTTKAWTDTLTLGSSDYKNSVTLKGARAMVQMIGFSSGYTIRNFDRDPVLANNPPPLYPKLTGESLQIDTWQEL
ncbi:MAG: hypothetical protein HGB10_04680 [Coriobacteriia bacterium]|nr:hypothetical protein [Coriobacteriia bacterium]